MFRKTSVFGAAALLLALGGTPAFAQQGPRPHPPVGGAGFAASPGARADDAPGGRAHLEMTVVYANHSGQVDPRLARMRNQFASMGFTGFQQLSTHDAQLSAGQDTSMNVEGGLKIDVTLLSRTDTAAKVRVQLERNGQKVIDTTATAPLNRALTVGGWAYQDGKLFVLINAD
jgi:hypothetical protein